MERLRLHRGVTQPVLKSSLPDARVIAGNERTLAQFGAVILRVGIGDHIARIVQCAETLADQIIETELFGPRDLNDAVHRRAQGDLVHRTGNILRRHGLDEHRRQANRVAVGGSPAMLFTNSKNCVA